MTERTERKQNRVEFRASDGLLEWLQQGIGTLQPAIGIVAQHELEVFTEALSREKAPELSEAEACLIVDALNGCIADEPPAVVPLLHAQIEDAIELGGLAGKWGIDGPALIAKLRALSFLQAYAVIRKARRYWQNGYSGQEYAVALRAVGLVR